MDVDLPANRILVSLAGDVFTTTAAAATGHPMIRLFTSPRTCFLNTEHTFRDRAGTHPRGEGLMFQLFLWLVARNSNVEHHRFDE